MLADIVRHGPGARGFEHSWLVGATMIGLDHLLDSVQEQSREGRNLQRVCVWHEGWSQAVPMRQGPIRETGPVAAVDERPIIRVGNLAMSPRPVRRGDAHPVPVLTGTWLRGGRKYAP
jgi:hypothetical protein